MNMKAVYIQDQVRTNCKLARAALRIPGAGTQAFAFLTRALGYARQMPDCPKWRSQRAYLVTAIEAIKL